MYTTRRARAQLEQMLSSIQQWLDRRIEDEILLLKSQFEVFGIGEKALSYFSNFLRDLDKTHKKTLDEVSLKTCRAAEHADSQLEEIANIGRGYLESVTNSCLIANLTIPDLPSKEQQQLTEYRAIFAQRLLDTLRDVETDCAELKKQGTPARPMRILFLAANPTTTSRLDLEEELRSLKSELQSVKYRDQVVLIAGHAARPDDLVWSVRSERPTVVHFSGHGSKHGIFLRNDTGGATAVTGINLQRFFQDRGVRLVVLNACYSREQAQLLPGFVSAVVGTTDEVGDHAARLFTVAFYRALGAGYSIREAFRDGRDSVVLNNRKDVFWAEGELDESLISPGASC